MHKHPAELFPDPPDSVLFLGTGAGELLETLPEECKVSIVTPDEAEYSRIAWDARRRLVSVEHAWISDVSSELRFSVFQIYELSSFRRPDAVLKYYPGLRVRRTSYPQGIGLNDILARHPFVRGGRNLLVLHLSGEEHHVLAAMQARSYLRRFDGIVVTATPEAWYEQAVGPARPKSTLTAGGFRLGFCFTDKFERRVMGFELNNDARVRAAQSHRLRSLKGLLGRQAQAVVQLRKEIQVIKEERDLWHSRAARFDQQAECLAKLQKHLARQNDRDLNGRSGEEEVARLKDLAARLTKQRDEASKEVSFYADKLAARTEDVELLRTELASSQQRESEQRIRHVAIEAEIERLRRIIDAMNDEFREVGQDSQGNENREAT